MVRSGGRLVSPKFLGKPIAGVCFLRILDRFGSQILESKWPNECNMFDDATPSSTMQHRPTMLEDVAIVWPGLKKSKDFQLQ